MAFSRSEVLGARSWRTELCSYAQRLCDRTGEQGENATGWRFPEAKSSAQGVEGRSYAPTRNDYATGQWKKVTTPYGGVTTPQRGRIGMAMGWHDNAVAERGEFTSFIIHHSFRRGEEGGEGDGDGMAMGWHGTAVAEGRRRQ